MKNYFKIIRPANLLFIGILTAFFYFGVLTPLLGQYGIRIPGSVPIFVLLEISAIFIAAGGYVVNDYFFPMPFRHRNRCRHRACRNRRGLHPCFPVFGRCGAAMVLFVKLQTPIPDWQPHNRHLCLCRDFHSRLRGSRRDDKTLRLPDIPNRHPA